jgi:hypothetical protein
MKPTKPEETPKTYLQQLFEGKDILTKRPPEMSYEDYRIIRKQQSNALKVIKVK